MRNVDVSSLATEDDFLQEPKKLLQNLPFAVRGDRIRLTLVE
jgi:hypothetical protein